MADPNKYKSLSVPREDWEQLGVLANKTNRTRSKMIGRLIRFFMELIDFSQILLHSQLDWQ